MFISMERKIITLMLLRTDNSSNKKNIENSALEVSRFKNFY
ncbi:unnamed protein product [marine sediment metagenome]|uniref:Uncharacterized protein n=1 Tax=marine sediment metagenome TaxID=412755 RepID=X0YDL9_9ZZZZ